MSLRAVSGGVQVPASQPAGTAADPLGARCDADSEFPARVERAACYVFWVYWAAWMTALALIWATHPGLHHGDSFSDGNVLNAGRNFDVWGMRLNYGLPTQDGTWCPDRPVPPYTGYPPGPEWLLQGWKALSLRELWQLRLAAVGVTALALLCAWHFFARLSGSVAVGTLAAFFYSWSAPFAQYADSLHQHAYMQLTLFVLLAAWLAFVRSQTPRARALWLSVVCVVFGVDLLLTFEHVLLVPLFFVAHAAWLRQRGHFRALVLIGVVGLATLALRVWWNSLALGGLDFAVRDLFSRAQYRGGLSSPSLSWSQLLQVWSRRLGMAPSPADFDAELAYPLLAPAVVFPALALLVLLLTTWHERPQTASRRALGYGLVLLASALAWWVAMRNHALVHRHLVMLLVPGLSLALAALAAGGLRQWWLFPGLTPRRWLGPLLGAALLLGFAQHTRASLTLNQVAAFEPGVRQIVERRWDTERLLARVGERLRGRVQRLWIVPEKAPETAYHLGLPYAFHMKPTLPTLQSGDMIWIDYWSDVQKALSWEAIDRFGLPDVLPAPCDLTLVFPAEGTRAEPADATFEGGIRLTALRYAPTLDGGGRAVLAQWELLEGATLRPEELVHVVEAMTADGRVACAGEQRLTWGPRQERRFVAIHRMSWPEESEAVQFRMTLWSCELNRSLRADLNATASPLGANLSQDGVRLLWIPKKSTEGPGAS